MKRSFLLITALLISSNLLAQDLKPGQATTALQNYKGNTDVDMATGILNYNIPLFTCDAPQYSLPISLSYNAGGIRNDQKPGISGLGWTLGFGAGTIGRTTRGISVDEDPILGILNNPIPAGTIGDATYDLYLEKVNSGKIDSESDLFTLNIQGASIKFILVKTGGQIQVKTLNKTDSKIELTVLQGVITQWKVTDPFGNVYTFSAAQPGNIRVPAGSPFVATESKAITSWFIEKISPFNGSDITFSYMTEEYVDMSGMAAASAVFYNPALTIPNLNDPQLRSQLESLKSGSSEASAIVEGLYNNIITLQKSAIRAGEAATAPAYGGMNNIVNQFDVDFYRAQVNVYSNQLNEIVAANNANTNAIVSVLNQMFNTTANKQVDTSNASRESLFVNKLLKSINLPTGELVFNYRKVQPQQRDAFYVLSNITFKNLANEQIFSVLLDINDYGYLKTIQWLNNSNLIKASVSMDYYFESQPNQYFKETATDYWGFYNGKTSNSNLFSNNPGYSTFNSASPIGYAFVFFPGGGGTGPSVPANRLPDPTYAIARSLKTINWYTGEKTDLVYEGNEIYSSDVDKNIAIGGLRIKSITQNDGERDRTTNYKYNFPSSANPSFLRSAGRLNEWQRKLFSWTFYFTGGTDNYAFTEPMYWGALYDDGSNNGVLYHYVEEVLPNNSYYGYKYAEVNPGYYLSNTTLPNHNSELDRTLLAKVAYNSNGKITQIEKFKYAYPSLLFKNRTSELTVLQSPSAYFEESGAIQPESVKQIKKEPIHFNQGELLKSFPNGVDSRYTVKVGTYTFSINPYTAYYLNDFQRREYHTQQALPYLMNVSSAVLPAQTERIEVQDYDLAAFNASANPTTLPNEAPYTFDRLLRYTQAAKVVATTSFSYTGQSSTLATITKTTDSRGRINLSRTKYAIDYSLPSTSNIFQLKSMNRVNEVIENQLWRSSDNGVSYKLVKGNINDYEKIISGGKTYIYPSKKYTTEFLTTLQPSTSGFTETHSSTSPYTSQFWENKSLYTMGESISSDVEYGALRLKQKNDKVGQSSETLLYGQNGKTILQASKIKKNQIIASDISPSVKHLYYSQTYGLFKEDAKGVFTDSTITFSFLSSKQYFELQSLPVMPATLDFYKLATDANNVLNNFKTQYPTDYNALLAKPLFKDFVDVFNCIATGGSTETFTPFIGRCTYDYSQSSFVTGDYFLMMNQLNTKGVNGYALWFCIDNLIKVLKEPGPNMPLVNLNEYSTFARRRDYKVDYLLLDEKAFKLSIDQELLLKRYVNLFYLLNSQSIGASNFNARVRVQYANGTFSSISNISIPNDKRLNKKTIDLNSFPNPQNIKSLEILIPNYDLRDRYSYITINPAGTFFKAYSYLPDGNLSVVFDQNMNFEESFYDALGRPHFKKNEKDEIVSMTEIKIGSIATATPKSTKINIRHNFRGDMYITPRLLKFDLTNSAAGTARADIINSLNIYPNQRITFEVPRANYKLDLKTDPGNYTLKFNGTVIPHTSTGLVQYDIDMSNLQELTVEIIPIS